MRVAVDARHLGGGRGVARYLESMLAALVTGHPEADWVAVVSPGQESLLPAGVTVARSAVPARLAHASAAVTGRPRIDRVAGGADVVWIPAPAPVSWSTAVPAVLTIHDLSWEQRPSDFTAYERAWHAAAQPRRLARRARRIVCVSEATREALIAEGWPVPPGKAEVIPEAPAVAATGAPQSGNGRYLLYVGALEPRKGIETLAEAIGVARSHGLTLPIVVVGQGRLDGLLSGIPGVEMKGQTSEAELAELYAGATALVLPSLLEGFGLPPVEAAACGVPTVASDLPVLREFLGDGFLAVPPGDASRLGDALFQVSTDGALRNRLGSAAREAVAGLSWEASADRLFTILRQASESPSP